MSTNPFYMFAVACLVIPSTASAVEFHTGNGNVSGNMCIGPGCFGFTNYNSNELILRGNSVRLLFEDNSTAENLPANDWQIEINEPFANSKSWFTVRDVTNAETAVFTLEAGARSDALYVDENGRVGLGENNPIEDLHIDVDLDPAIRLEQSSNTFGDQVWDIGANETNLFFRDVSGGSALPFRLLDDVPSGMLGITPDGVGIFTNDAIGSIDIRARLDVNGDALVRTDLKVSNDLQVGGNLGIGTDTPSAQFEMSSTDSFNFFRITAQDAAVNQSVDITFTGGPLGTGQLRYNIVDGDNQEMSLDADGNMVLDGTLTTTGTTCGGGCDRVFTENAVIPAAEYAQTMWRQGYLPHVGPTPEGQPIDLTHKMGGMLNALEHAHVFIAQTRSENATLRAQVAAQEARLAALEAALDAR